MVSKQIESCVSYPSIQNPKMSSMKIFTFVTRIKHQATINRYAIIEFSSKQEVDIHFEILKSRHSRNLAKEIHRNLTGKVWRVLLSTSFLVLDLSARPNPMTSKASYFKERTWIKFNFW